MFKLKSVFFGERSVTKVAGLFDSNEVAQHAAQNLIDHSPLDASQVRVLGPSDTIATYGSGVGRGIGRAVEPEQQGIWRTLIKSHLAAGVLGMLAGGLVFVLLMAIGFQAVVSTPGLSLLALAGFGLMFGLMVGGALSLRPDHGRVITVVRHGLEHGQWAVIAHPRDARQTHLAVKALQPGSARVVRSF
ncbi:MAG: hypothetical protein LPJ87_08665 [Zoogloeaceae bacterium]|nr:hypothetical protein [Zoogloeaceae bacterium]